MRTDPLPLILLLLILAVLIVLLVKLFRSSPMSQASDDIDAATASFNAAAAKMQELVQTLTATGIPDPAIAAAIGRLQDAGIAVGNGVDALAQLVPLAPETPAAPAAAAAPATPAAGG